VVDELGVPVRGARIVARAAQMAEQPEIPKTVPMRGRSLQAVTIKTRTDAEGRFCHRSDQNQPGVVDSKPAT
jgi:hypothetical protein